CFPHSFSYSSSPWRCVSFHSPLALAPGRELRYATYRIENTPEVERCQVKFPEKKKGPRLCPPKTLVTSRRKGMSGARAVRSGTGTSSKPPGNYWARWDSRI